MTNGYALADEIFNKIGKNEKHEATVEDAPGKRFNSVLFEESEEE